MLQREGWWETTQEPEAQPRPAAACSACSDSAVTGDMCVGQPRAADKTHALWMQVTHWQAKLVAISETIECILQVVVEEESI